MEEQWKPIDGFENHYEISDFGNVRSIDRFVDFGTTGTKFYKGQAKSKNPHYKNGYLSVSLKVKGIEKRVFIHRLVAIHFITNPENKPEVNHLDGDKNNNYISNLEWATAKENSQHAVRTGLHNLSKKVIAVKGPAILEFNSMMECSKSLGVCNSHVGKCAKNGRLVKGHLIVAL